MASNVLFPGRLHDVDEGDAITVDCDPFSSHLSETCESILDADVVSIHDSAEVDKVSFGPCGSMDLEVLVLIPVQVVHEDMGNMVRDVHHQKDVRPCPHGQESFVLF
jgi:hypothetical protein